jgi:hypothetical protein
MYTWQRPSRVKSQGSFFEHVGESSRRRVESFLVFDDDDDVDDDPVESRVKDMFLNMSVGESSCRRVESFLVFDDDDDDDDDPVELPWATCHT